MKREANCPVFSTNEAVSFGLDKEQVEKANKWMVRHKCSRRGSYGAVGDKVSFNFLPTGIGTFITMKCSCGKEVDLTNDV